MEEEEKQQEDANEEQDRTAHPMLALCFGGGCVNIGPIRGARKAEVPRLQFILAIITAFAAVVVQCIQMHEKSTGLGRLECPGGAPEFSCETEQEKCVVYPAIGVIEIIRLLFALFRSFRFAQRGHLIAPDRALVGTFTSFGLGSGVCGGCTTIYGTAVIYAATLIPLALEGCVGNDLFGYAAIPVAALIGLLVAWGLVSTLLHGLSCGHCICGGPTERFMTSILEVPLIVNNIGNILSDERSPLLSAVETTHPTVEFFLLFYNV